MSTSSLLIVLSRRESTINFFKSENSFSAIPVANIEEIARRVWLTELAVTSRGSGGVVVERERPRLAEAEIEAEVKCHRDSGETSIPILIEARVFAAAIMYSYGASRRRQARSGALAGTSHRKRFPRPLRGCKRHYRRGRREREQPRNELFNVIIIV